MNKIITVLHHEVQCKTAENINLDQEFWNEVHDEIREMITDGCNKDKITMFVELEDETTIDIKVEWWIYNPWEEIADELYKELLWHPAGKSKGKHLYEELKAKEDEV